MAQLSDLRFNISDYDLKAESHVTKERDQQPHHEDTLQGFCSPARNLLRAIRRGTAKALERILMMWLLVALFCHMALGL